MKNGLPELTHLQYAVIDIIGEDTVVGTELQILIRKHTLVTKLPKVQFYLLMCSLVAIGAVKAVPSQKSGWPHISYTRTDRGYTLAMESYLFYN